MMGEYLYEVLVDGAVVATNMPISYAVILAEGVFDKYYNATKMEVTIRRVDNSIESVDKVWKKVGE